MPWDLTFGSGMQTLGALVAVVAVAWCLQRARLIEELGGETIPVRLLALWLRYIVPAVILLVGAWWLATEVFGLSP